MLCLCRTYYAHELQTLDLSYHCLTVTLRNLVFCSLGPVGRVFQEEFSSGRRVRRRRQRQRRRQLFVREGLAIQVGMLGQQPVPE